VIDVCVRSFHIVIDVCVDGVRQKNGECQEKPEEPEKLRCDLESLLG
jgi:hypothetical protein